MGLLMGLMEGGSSESKAAQRMAGVKGQGLCVAVGSSVMPRLVSRRHGACIGGGGRREGVGPGV